MKSIRNPHQDRRGVFILIAMICVLLITMIGASLVKLALAENKQVRREKLRLQATWLAESGLERAAAQLARKPEYEGETWEIPAEDLKAEQEGSVLIRVNSIEGAPNRRRVSAVANFPKGTEQRACISKEVVVDL